MFKKARLRLTVWYLLIIMVISFLFSAFIYRSVSLEFQRRLNVIGMRLEQGGMRMGHGKEPVHHFAEDIKEAQRQVSIILIYTNGVVLVISGIAGYFLAGKTLRPIETAMDDQKRFITDASHEVKTPLTAMRTSIEVALRDKKLTLKEAKNTLKGNLEDIDDLKSLTNNLLELTRYQQNGDNLSFEEIDLKKLVNSSLNKMLPLAEKKKIKVVKRLNKTVISANEESIKRLISILFDNATKYTPKDGKINVSVSKRNRYALLVVKDNGSGIPEDDIPFIFDRFYRSDKARTKVSSGGYGLGLSIAKRIVDVHNGTIRAESTPEKGTTFTVRLPIS